MANVTLKGNPIHTVGELPKISSPGPDFRLTRGGLSDISLADFEGKVEILNIVPTLDTGVGAASARARAGSSRPGVPGSALKPRAILIAYRIGVGTERGSELDRPPPRPLPLGGGISYWTADISFPPNGRD